MERPGPNLMALQESPDLLAGREEDLRMVRLAYELMGGSPNQTEL